MPRAKRSSRPSFNVPAELLSISGPSRLDGAKLRDLYQRMSQARAAAFAAKTRGDAPRPGCEAVDVACTAELQPDDIVVASRSITLAARARSLRVSNGSVVAFAAGLAAAKATTQDQDLVLAFRDQDESMRIRGNDDHELIATAARERWPLVVVSTLRSEAAATPSPDGVARFVVDGNDAIALYRVSQEAGLRARMRQAPTIVECHFHLPYSAAQERTFFSAHGTAANASIEHDPIAFLESYMRAKGAWHME